MEIFISLNLRTVEASLEPVTEFKDMINTLVLK